MACAAASVRPAAVGYGRVFQPLSVRSSALGFVMAAAVYKFGAFQECIAHQFPHTQKKKRE